MRSSSLRLALPLTALLVSLALPRLTAADPAPAEPAKDTPAPAASTPAPAAAAATDSTSPAVTVPPPTPADAPAPAAAPASAAVPVPVPDQATAEAKLAVVLRSYSLMQEENDQLKAALEKARAEKSSVDAQFSVAKDALPVAAQAATLREQLRQTQDQLAALALENNQLKTRLAIGAPAPGTANLTPVNVPTTLPPAAVPAAAPAARIHVVVAGETLGKIARKYYGNVNRWPDILNANSDVLKNEKGLVAGMKLRIP